MNRSLSRFGLTLAEGTFEVRQSDIRIKDTKTDNERSMEKIGRNNFPIVFLFK